MTKPNVTFQGQGLKTTVIVWNDTATTAKKHTRKRFGVHQRRRICRQKHKFQGKLNRDAVRFSSTRQDHQFNLVFSSQNAAPAPKPGVEGAQAVALRITTRQPFGAADSSVHKTHCLMICTATTSKSASSKAPSILSLEMAARYTR